MKHAYLIVLLFFSISGLLSAQQPTFRGTAVESPSPEVFGRMFSEYRLFQIEAPILSRQAQRSPGNFRFQLNLGGEYAWPLALEAHDIRSGDYRLVAVGPEGEQQQPRSATRTFRGAVLGPQGGEARLTIDEHFLYGFVESAGETYYIEPAWPFDPTLPEDTYLVYPAGAVLNAGNYTCGWNEEDRHEVPEAHELPAPEAGRVILACYQVDIALAADFMMVQRFGSVTGVENFMLGVLNNVQTNFDNEFVHELFFSVATIFVSACSNCDPWTSSRSAGLLLDDFAIWGNSGGFGTNFDVASLWTDRDFFGDAIGVAWVGSVCTSNRYNILQNFSTNSALLRVLQAHELGHNFGTGHDAPGSSFIMAPSVNFTNTWSAQSRANINSFVNSLISFPGCLAACGSVAPPSPALAANVTSGCTPLVVNFSDISSGQVDDISWQFPGGSPSSSSSFSPTVTYNTPGTFDVILTVSNSGGANTIVMDNYITVALSPTPQFSYSANGLAVSFTNTSVNAQDFQWSFGDGDFSNATDPVHTFPADGLYLVALTTTNACGTFSFEEFVIVELPMQAGFSADNALGCAGSTVNFTDLSTGAPVAWQWAFEGGMPAVSDQPNPAVTYETPGAYDVSLTVTNAVGTTSNYVLPTYIAILPNPSAGFTYQYASGGLNVQFNNTSAGADDWLWDFGDGTTSSQEDPTHTYAADGNYTVTLTISSQCGTDEMVQNIEVATAPTAAFSAGVLSGCAPLEVQFANASSPNAGSFQWTFQGGTPASSTLANPVVSFNNAGDYTVTLVAANAAGSDTITQNITIEAGPQSNFTVDYAPGETEAAFSDQSGNADSLIWIFSNGTTSTEVNPTFDFGTDGVYPVTLVTVNACGSDTLTQLVEVVTPPTAAIGLGADFGCAPFTVQASDLSGSNTTTWTWAAPGATPDASDEQNPAFTFNAPGTYTITLVAANAAGQSSSSTTVTVGSIPEAAFAASTTLGQTALGLSNNSTDADSYLWDFGDGNTSTEPEPAYTYTQDGTYTVQLIAANNCGSDTTSQEVTIVTPPAAAFELDATVGCAPFAVQASDRSGSNTTTWAWTAPGATPDASDEQNPAFTFNAPGIYTITLVAANAAGQSSSSTTVTVGSVPEAAFAASTTLGQTALGLSNNSTDADSYLWDFGDGNTSTEAEPAHNYTQDGTYTVLLIATNSCGSDTANQEVTIVTPPAAAFELDAVEGCAPLTVQASDQSGSNTTTWAWTAPGATPDASDEQNPAFTFNAPGTYTITLVAANAAGQSSSSTTVTVGSIPEAAFAASTALGQTALGLSNNSTDADSYLWDFGDGNTSTEAEPAHNYTQDGTYTVLLTATNSCGSDTATQEVTIVTPPAAAFELDAVAGCAPFTVQASDQSGSNTTTWAWTAPGATPDASSEQNPSFTFATPGTYTIILEAANAAGQSQDTIEVFVNGRPEPGFTFQVNGLEAQFTNTSGNSQSYQWDFGDGSSSQAFSPGHTYGTPGEYVVSLAATNECGMATAVDTVTLDLAAPVASFTVAGSQGCAPLVVTFQNNSENEESVSWSFPGGTPSSSTEPNPTVTYETPGLFSVTLVASNAAGSGTFTLQDVILVDGRPLAGFDYVADEATVIFTNTTDNADSYAWDFGDGNSSNAAEPQHTYSLGGEYTVTLLASNECGTDTTEQVVTLTGMAPAPDLSASVTQGCAPLSVTFDGGVQETVTSWSWSFPGGTPATSAEPSPTVVYGQPGVYGVSLTVGNAFGQNTQEEMALITVIDVPQASFDYDIQELTLVLANTSAGAGLSYNWDFGDGAVSQEENPQHTYAQAGEYTVALTVANACGEALAETKVVAVVSGLADESWLEELSVFPNPNGGAFTVRLQGRAAEQLRLSLLNVVGQRVFELADSFHTGYWQQGLEMEGLPAGVYVLEVMAGERRAYRRVVVE